MNPSPSPGSNRLSGFYAEAMACKNRYDFQGAIQVLRRAHKLDPANDKILIDLGTTSAQAYDFAAAEQYFENAVCVAASKMDALNAAGDAWLEAMHFDAARKCFERVLAEQQTPVFTIIRLVRVYIRMRLLDDALEMVQRGLHAHAGNAGLTLMHAKVLHQMQRLPEAENILRGLVSTDQPAEVRAWAWYELGAVLDRQARYDGAMSAFLEAKAILRSTAGPAFKVLQRKQIQLREMVEKVKENPMPRWRKFGGTDLQPPRKLALLCGYARSGTTLLESILDSHPQVVSADETSVFHNVAYFPLGSRSSPSSSFLSVLDAMPGRILRQVRTDYFRGIESFLGQPVGDRLLVDKNPSYTFDLPTILRIFPELKLLIALRDPRDVCLSCFMQPAPMIGDMSAWLTLEGTMEHYAQVMNLWLAWKPWLEQSAIEVRYEDVVQDLEAASTRTLQFLDLPWDERVLQFNEHAGSKIVRSPTFAEVSKPVYKTAIARWRNYEKYFEPHLSKLSRFTAAFGYE